MNEHVSNLEVERAVLGAVLCGTDVESQRVWSWINDAIGTPLAFYSKDNQLVALVMSELWNRGRPCDLMTVYDGMRQVSYQAGIDALAKLRGRKLVLDFNNRLEHEDSVAMAIGGVNALSDLMSAGCRNERAIKANASIVAEHYRQREALRLVTGASAKLQSPSGRTDLRPIVEDLTETLIRMIGGRSGTRSVEEAFESVVVAHDAAKGADKRKLPTWPLEQLNRMCRFRDGSFVVLAATSGGGKTSLALQTADVTAEHIATPGCVGIVSREMAAEDLTRIMLSRRIGVSVEDLEGGNLPASVLDSARDNLVTIGKNIVICDSLEKLSYKEVCAWARSQQTRTNGGLRLLVVDHLGLLDPENPRQSEYERITAATRAFKALAMELRIVVLALCQLNREGQRRQMGGKGTDQAYGAEDFAMVDLKGSGSIGHDADQCVFICKQGQDGNQVLPCKIKVDKNRWGSRGEFPAIFNKAQGQRFEQKGSAHNHGQIPDTPPSDKEDLF